MLQALRTETILIGWHRCHHRVLTRARWEGQSRRSCEDRRCGGRDARKGPEPRNVGVIQERERPGNSVLPGASGRHEPDTWSLRLQRPSRGDSAQDTPASGRYAWISPGVCFLVTVHEAVTHGRAWQDPRQSPTLPGLTHIQLRGSAGHANSLWTGGTLTWPRLPGCVRGDTARQGVSGGTADVKHSAFRTVSEVLLSYCGKSRGPVAPPVRLSPHEAQ